MKRFIAAVLALMLLAASCLAEAQNRELSEWFGKDIAEAARALGGLEYAEGTEFKDNYVGGTLALRGKDGKVDCIELTGAAMPAEGTLPTEGTLPDLTDDGALPDALCGVTLGMKRDDVIALMAGLPMPWSYDEEIAWIVRADAQNELNSEMLVVFFDEDGRVNGAWYRTSGT